MIEPENLTSGGPEYGGTAPTDEFSNWLEESRGSGHSQHRIMAIHGHTEAKTSEVYTKGVERWTLAANAMRTPEDMEW